MFIAQDQVRMHDTDAAGILYFPRQFRFVHDALEDFAASEGLLFGNLFLKGEFVFVVVHAEADYLKPLMIGDKLEVHLEIERIGESSFTVAYGIYRNGNELVGRAKTVHVTLDNKTRTKIPIPENLKQILVKHAVKK